jgi:hypothetical protein
VAGINPIDRDVICPGLGNLIPDDIGVVWIKMFPGVCPAVAGIDIVGITIDEEDPKMVVTVVTGGCEDGVVLCKFNDVVELEFGVVEFNHFAPPCLAMLYFSFTDT